MINLVILGSGRGSNAQAILEAQAAGKLGDARVTGILSDKADAPILKLGPRYGVHASYIHPGSFKTKMAEEAEYNYVAKINELKAHFVVLAGFMRVIKSPLLHAFPQRIINLHPSLLPKYPGLHSIRRAFEGGETKTGCTVHWVDDTVDGGEIIKQSVVRIEKTDTLETLEEKVHAAEHALLPAIISELSQKKSLL